MHLVHLRSDLGSVEAGTAEADGLAVLGVFFHLVAEEAGAHTGVSKLLRGLKRVAYGQFLHTKKSIIGQGLGGVDETARLPRLSLSELLPDPADRQVFYRYDGSLTTPPCSEAVVWTVLVQSLPVTPSQVRFGPLQPSAPK